MARALLSTVLLAACESPMAPTACGPLPQVTVHVGETVSVTACFNDPNGDPLGYALASSNPSVATASLAGSVVNVDAVAPGSATINLTARDTGGLQGQASFRVVVPNRPPRVRGSIPAQRVEAGREVVVDLSAWFEEPDGESLVFRIVPSDVAVVGVALSGARATFVGLAKGVAEITATATDPGGLAAVQTFRFEVPNRGPVAVGVIEGQVMERGETRVIDLAPWFDDPDGDPLAYTASSSRPGAVAAAASGASLRLTALATGRATVTVTARDPDGLTDTHSFGAEAPNHAPLPVGPIPAQAIRPGETAAVDVSAYFDDPDGDALEYAASSSDPSVATVSISASVVAVAALMRGSATIEVTATDPGGLGATQTFEATVANRGPEATGAIPDRSVGVGETAALDGSAYFSDPDGDPLTYSASSSDAGIAAVQVFGATLELTGMRKGVVDITVTAADPGGLAATLSFQATVGGDEEPPGSFRIELRLATAMSMAQKAAFERASARWMALLADTELPDMPVPEGVVEVQIGGRTYRERVSAVDDLMIVAAVAEIDGRGEILGWAGPRELHAGSMLPWLGVMEFDAADLDDMQAKGTLDAVILHEMGHVLGIGSLWGYFGLLRNPSLEAEREVDTHFTGPRATRAFDEVGGASYTAGAKVPVENRGTGPGSDDSHWRKNVFGPELMSPSIAPGGSPLSAVTVASLSDMGYAVRMDLTDTYRLPGPAALLEHRRRAIPLGNDVIRIPMKVRDRNGRVVGVIRP
jgi:hypothetical protein